MSIFEDIFVIDKNSTNITGLTDELKIIYTYNRFIQEDESIVFLVNSLYEATVVYQRLLNYTNDVLLFPMDDFLTSEALAISPELKNTRIETLISALSENKKIIVTNMMGYLRYLPPKNIFKEKTIFLKKNNDYDIKELVEKCYELGYVRETLVNKTGEIAVRGFVFDIFPISFDKPIRIEFWGDTIESIRVFDIDSQATIKEINHLTISPNTELLVKGKLPDDLSTQKDLVNYLKPTNIAGYLNNPKIIINDYSQFEVGYKMLLTEVLNYQQNNLTTNKKYMHDFFELSNNLLNISEFHNVTDKNNIIKYKSSNIEQFSTNTNLINQQLNKYLSSKKTVIICISSNKLINKFMDEIANKKIVFTNERQIFSNKLNVINKIIMNGFEIDNYIVISENEIFNTKSHNTKYSSNFKMGSRIRDINKINTGDYIVHNTHGIGKYCGIEKVIKNGLSKDYLLLEYRGNDKLYIPVEKIDVISKYSTNDSVIPKLSKLGGTEWAKTKLRVKTKIEDIAGLLLKLYAEREFTKGFAFLKDTEEQKEFEKEFKFTETEDQKKVIYEIKKDMEKDSPMDRLLCGDVGYGKTEVAFRAMFKAVMSGKQVALLCPTTILSNQHYLNAIERFKSFAVNIVLLNRFVSNSDAKKILEKIKRGQVDIVIGTHRILSDDIQFKNLGLLVIDEEQRFGVKHKEKIKTYKNTVDVLTLTATPIPRTLQMTFAGIRSLSLIETPPSNRYPVQTYVMANNDYIIKDAIYKEKSRNGQVFILYNSVKNMPKKELEIKRLVPDLRVVSVHGQMDKRTIEKIMLEFYNYEYDVLLCTTIIETGIDIPRVNTLIIIDAHRFGLSQLYQIRGRVGRSDKIAYCYLMYDNKRELTEIARKRLSVISEFTELGSGFSIAMRDLSIRGAGDILGSEQAGFIDTIGVELFMKMLSDEVKQLKGEIILESPKDDNIMPLIDVDTSIDDNYVEEEELKIEIHKKINTIDSYNKLLSVKKEIEDRFGKINEKMLIYMYQEWFESLTEKLNIENIKQTKNFIEIEIPTELTNKLNIQELFNEVNEISKMFRFGFKRTRLIITLDTLKLDKHFVYYLIELLELIDKSYK